MSTPPPGHDGVPPSRPADVSASVASASSSVFQDKDVAKQASKKKKACSDHTIGWHLPLCAKSWILMTTRMCIQMQ